MIYSKRITTAHAHGGETLPLIWTKITRLALCFWFSKRPLIWLTRKFCWIRLDYMAGGTVETVNWFKLYLSDRRQCVKIKGLKSSLMPVKQGVPQGSSRRLQF